VFFLCFIQLAAGESIVFINKINLVYIEVSNDIYPNKCLKYVLAGVVFSTGAKHAEFSSFVY